MSIISLMALALGMSMDAFATAIAKGATYQNPSLVRALKAGVLFGAIEGVAPIVGWLLGEAAQGWLSHVDHWLAFVLLGFLAIKFMRDALKGDVQIKGDQQTMAKSGFGLMLITAVATSIDSLVVGVSLAFLEVNIWLAAVLIGLATMIMVTLGLYLGNRLGLRFGRVAMFVGGVVLLMIGTTILVSHLMSAS
ncbi:manganese efflux pump MntP family protein [Moraxella sp.]|uniref:manganese efflux pump MntP n=1 Tax=Moraxella sp. TaxID=479 RepID=UPI00260675E2|nr:manganese efflux pump MntP family protein [Moraxella sp.]MCP3897435.1 manganese efflux pump MntP family protein [Moraxella sp.]